MDRFVTEQEILGAIDSLGVAGKPVCIHASLRSFGMPLEGGPDMLIRCFGRRDCTILVPAFSNMLETEPAPEDRLRHNGMEEVCEDRAQFTGHGERVKASMGVFPRYVLDDPGCITGDHPLNAFASVGPMADRLVRGQQPLDVYAPFRSMYELDGYVLLMGVNLTKATVLHYAEQVAGRRLFVRWARRGDGAVIKAFVGGCSRGFQKFEPLLRPAIQTAAAGKSVWQCLRVKDAVNLCADRIGKEPSITHCDDKDCIKCNDAVKGGPVPYRTDEYGI